MQRTWMWRRINSRMNASWVRLEVPIEAKDPSIRLKAAVLSVAFMAIPVGEIPPRGRTDPVSARYSKSALNPLRRNPKKGSTRPCESSAKNSRDRQFIAPIRLGAASPGARKIGMVWRCSEFASRSGNNRVVWPVSILARSSLFAEICRIKSKTRQNADQSSISLHLTHQPLTSRRLNNRSIGCARRMQIQTVFDQWAMSPRSY